MIKWIIFPLLLCLASGAVTKHEDKIKPTSTPINAIQHQSPKYETVYQPVKYQQVQVQPQYQPKPQYVPVQIIPKQYYMQQPQPQAMIIIAQPALVPQSILYQNPTQQLLQYFHSNPQAKYQLLHGNQQQTATYMHPVVAAPINNFLYPTQAPQETPVQYTRLTQQLPKVAPKYQFVPKYQPAQYTQSYQPTTPEPQMTQSEQYPMQQLGNIAHLAQLAAQRYVTAPTKTPSAIVTGFDQFSPEQQAQIKAQLSSHLGSNYHAVQNSAQYYKQDEFVPSPEIKTEAVRSQNQDSMKTQYTKEKN